MIYMDHPFASDMIALNLLSVILIIACTCTHWVVELGVGCRCSIFSFLLTRYSLSNVVTVVCSLSFAPTVWFSDALIPRVKDCASLLSKYGSGLQLRLCAFVRGELSLSSGCLKEAF
jgi:hypothetical protein